VLVTAGTVFWSTAGLFVRLLDLDIWTMQGWRALFGGLSLLVVIGIDRGRDALRALVGIGRPGLVAAPIAAISMLSYVAALQLTTVANVLTVYATVPFMAAAVAYLWIGERIGWRAVVAGGAALVGVAIMAAAATRRDDIAGNALSLLMTLTFAVLIVMARRYPSLAMAPVNVLGTAICVAACWPLMQPALPPLRDLLVLALFGATTSGLAYMLFLTGSRLIPSSEAGLIALLDVVLGPLWVWLVFSEEPGLAALIGGGIVLTALVWYLSASRPAAAR
jgi:drug/metabolite transporter (DMT)-like permease